jgi:hypothetical protein
MNKEKKIMIIGISLAGVFVLLAAVLYLNAFFKSKNIIAKINNTKNPAAEIVPVNKEPVASLTAEQIENAKYKEKRKESIMKEMDKIRAAAPKNIADVYKNVSECSGLKDENGRDTCVVLWAEFKKDASLCVKIAEAKRQDCQDRVLAAKAKTIDDCESISNTAIKQTCRDNFIPKP